MQGGNLKLILKKKKEFNGLSDVNNGGWTHKSLDMIRKWIINRYKYHKSVVKYFDNREKDILYIDITSDDSSVIDIIDFLEIEDANIVKKFSLNKQIKYNILNIDDNRYVHSNFPHSNKRKINNINEIKNWCGQIFEEAIESLDAKYLEDEVIQKY